MKISSRSTTKEKASYPLWTNARHDAVKQRRYTSCMFRGIHEPSVGFSLASVAQVLGQWLLKHGVQRLGQPELAARIDVSEDVLQAWVNGHSQIPEIVVVELVDVIHELNQRVSTTFPASR